jgi:hypothetical protein
MNRNLLNRKSEYPELVELTDFIDKTIDFGTRIFDCEVEANKIYKENIVCQTFFKNILEIGDGISILITKSSIDNAKILLRSLVENLFYLEYLLENESKNRALAYLVTTFHSEIKFNSKIDKNSSEGQNFRNVVLKDKTYQNTPFLEPRIQPERKGNGFTEIFNYPDFKKGEQEYQRTAAKKSNPSWYSLYDGPFNIEQLASHLNQHALYEILYRNLSENVHSSNIIKYSLANFEQGPGLSSMRNPENADMIASLTLVCLEMAYGNFVDKRILSKATDYEEWQRGFSKDFDKLFN